MSCDGFRRTLLMWVPTIYILGSGVIFQNALEGLQMVFDPTSGSTPWSSGGGSVGVLIQLAIIVGILALAGKNLMSQRAEWHHIIIAVALYMALFVPTTSVLVQNLYNGDTRPVDGIPIGIAYPAGLISQISFQMMNVVDQVDSNPTGAAPPIDLEQGGFAQPLMTFYALRYLPQSFDAANPDLAYTIADFAKNCNANSPTFGVGSDIDNSADVVSSITSHYNATGYTVEYTTSYPWGGNGYGVNCSTAARDITTAWTAFAGSNTSVMVTGGSMPLVDMNKLVAQVVATPGGTNTAQGSGQALSTAEGALDDGMPQCNTSATGAASTCVASNQGLAFLEDEISGCVATAGVAFASDSTATEMHASAPSFCSVMSTGMANQENNNASTASAFEANVIPMMTILQFLFFALAPLVAVVIAFMGAQGAGLYIKYVMFGVWTQSWLPVVAIINDYAQFISQGAFTNMISTAGGADNPATLTHLATMPQVFSTAQLALSNANMMVSLTPMITLAVLTGSFMAMTQLGKAMGSESTMASADKLTTPQMGATTFNAGATGYGGVSNEQGTWSAMNSTEANAPSVSISHGYQTAAANKYAQSQTSSQQASAAISATSQTMADLSDQYKNNQSLDNTLGAKLSTSYDNSSQVITKAMTKAGLSTDAQQQIKHTAAADASLGMSAEGIAGKLTNQYASNATGAQKAALEHAFDTVANESIGMKHDVTSLSDLTAKNGVSSAQAADLKKSLADTRLHAAQAAEQAQQGDAYSRDAQATSGVKADQSIDGKKLTQAEASTPGGPAMATKKQLEAMNSASPEEKAIFDQKLGMARKMNLSEQQAVNTALLYTANSSNGGAAIGAIANTMGFQTGGAAETQDTGAQQAIQQGRLKTNPNNPLSTAVENATGPVSVPASTGTLGSHGLTPNQGNQAASTAQGNAYDPTAVAARNQTNDGQMATWDKQTLAGESVATKTAFNAEAAAAATLKPGSAAPSLAATAIGAASGVAEVAIAGAAATAAAATLAGGGGAAGAAAALTSITTLLPGLAAGGAGVGTATLAGAGVAAGAAASAPLDAGVVVGAAVVGGGLLTAALIGNSFVGTNMSQSALRANTQQGLSPTGTTIQDGGSPTGATD
ncbi:conjugal transfer protein TraG [Acidithiobacillus ferrivorans]|nr:conjugal transfer protein TraG [Acidithiobacillus ferrivorans]